MEWNNKEIENYCIQHSTRPGPIALELMQDTRDNIHGSQMLIGEMEASVIKFLMRLGKVKTVVEFGTYTGFSALIMAEELPEDGKVYTIDINPHTTKLAREYWDKSGHGHKIQQILKPGLEALNELNHKYDFIFIDADKNNYTNYLNWALEHLSESGFILTDNTLWSGKVLLQSDDKQTTSIQEHNKRASELTGYTKTLLPIRDGMFLITKG